MYLNNESFLSEFVASYDINYAVHVSSSHILYLPLQFLLPTYNYPPLTSHISHPFPNKSSPTFPSISLFFPTSSSSTSPPLLTLTSLVYFPYSLLFPHLPPFSSLLHPVFPHIYAALTSIAYYPHPLLHPIIHFSLPLHTTSPATSSILLLSLPLSLPTPHFKTLPNLTFSTSHPSITILPLSSLSPTTPLLTTPRFPSHFHYFPSP